MMSYALVLTCEHAGNNIPDRFLSHFQNAQADLSSHRGWDPGALQLAEQLADYFTVPLFAHHTSRLLVEINRSVGHPQLWSEYTAGLTTGEKEEVLNAYYWPYRQQVEAHIASLVAADKCVVHLSVHTFTPLWEGIRRAVEIGLLFDEARNLERAFCEVYEETLRHESTFLVRPNEPYQGSADGFTTYLRTKFDQSHYLGVELEISQEHAQTHTQSIARLLSTSLQHILNNPWK